MKKERTGQVTPGQKKCCVFSVGGRDFLLPAEQVTAILDIAKICPMPGAPEYVYSAMPQYGRIITAIDLSSIYNIEKMAFVNPKLVVVHVKRKDIGFLSHTTPFFITYVEDMIVDDLIDARSFFDTYSLT
jgi:chemotaxis signal transduction protein